MAYCSSSIPFTPRIVFLEWIAAFAVFSGLPFLFDGYHWQEALLSGLAVASVYTGGKALLVFILRLREKKKEKSGRAEVPGNSF